MSRWGCLVWLKKGSFRVRAVSCLLLDHIGRVMLGKAFDNK